MDVEDEDGSRILREDSISVSVSIACEGLFQGFTLSRRILKSSNNCPLCHLKNVNRTPDDWLNNLDLLYCSKQEFGVLGRR